MTRILPVEQLIARLGSPEAVHIFESAWLAYEHQLVREMEKLNGKVPSNSELWLITNSFFNGMVVIWEANKIPISVILTNLEALWRACLNKEDN